MDVLHGSSPRERVKWIAAIIRLPLPPIMHLARSSEVDTTQDLPESAARLGRVTDGDQPTPAR